MLETNPTTAIPTMLAFALLLGAAACDDGDEMEGDAGDDASAMDAGDDGMASRCADETRADDFAAGLTKDGAAYRVRVEAADPADPVRGDNAWTLMITDLEGSPIEGVVVDAKPWMPDHGHGSAVEEEVIEMGGGEYQVAPLNLFMAGYWEVHLELSSVDVDMDEVMIGVCVE